MNIFLCLTYNNNFPFLIYSVTVQVSKFSDTQKTPRSREHWIDISRFIAACLIVCIHAPAFSFASLFQLPVFNGCVAFFLILAGFFMGRNNSWEKAFKRGYTLLIPFLFWNVVISLFHPEIINMGMREYLCNLVGFRSLFTPDFNPFPIKGLLGEPFSTPTWFLRDIILCSLISPLLLKLKYLVLVLILIYFSTDWFQYPVPANKITLAPFTVSLFSLGLFLSSIKLEQVKRFYKNSFTPFLLLSISIGFLLSITNYLSVCQNNPEWNMHKILTTYGVWNIHWPAVHLNSICPIFGALLLMALGIWLEQKVPVAKKLSNYAPACFLIFVLHYPLIMCIPPRIWKQSFFAPFVLIPSIISLIIVFYLFLRKFFPTCLPYVANDRITHVPPKN